MTLKSVFCNLGDNHKFQFPNFSFFATFPMFKICLTDRIIAQNGNFNTGYQILSLQDSITGRLSPLIPTGLTFSSLLTQGPQNAGYLPLLPFPSSPSLVTLGRNYGHHKTVRRFYSSFIPYQMQ